MCCRKHSRVMVSPPPSLTLLNRGFLAGLLPMVRTYHRFSGVGPILDCHGRFGLLICYCRCVHPPLFWRSPTNVPPTPQPPGIDSLADLHTSDCSSIACLGAASFRSYNSRPLAELVAENSPWALLGFNNRSWPSNAPRAVS